MERDVEAAFAKKFKRGTFVPVGGEKNADLSPPPSPFLSLSTSSHTKENLPLSTLQSLKQKLENELERISDDSNDVSSFNDKKVDDKMSLSSLSPEDPSTIKLPPNPPLPDQLPPPLPPDETMPVIPADYYGGFNAMPYNPYMVPWNMAPEYQTPYYPPDYNHYHQHLRPENGLQYEGVEEDEEKPLDPYDVSEMVIQRIYNELTDALRKDIRRRIIEAEAFKKFDTWCLKREQHYKESKDKEAMEVEKRAIAHISSLNKDTFFDTADNDTTGPLGLGIRCSIPKLPSFRRRVPRAPSPNIIDEDSRKSFDSDLARTESDSEPTPTKRSGRRLSFSSDETSSSSESSSEDDSEVDSVSSFESGGRGVIRKSEAATQNLLLDKLETESISETSDFESSPIRKDEVSSELPNDEKSYPIEVKPEVLSVNDLATIKTEVFDLPQETADIKQEKPEVLDIDESNVWLDHNYCLPAENEEYDTRAKEVLPVFKQEKVSKKSRRFPQTSVPRVFSVRDKEAEDKIRYEFFQTLDMEDLQYFKIAFERACLDETNSHSYWLNSTHWVDYPPIIPSPKKLLSPESTKIHETGCARTEGYYKLNAAEKSRNRRQWGSKHSKDNNSGAVGAPSVGTAGKTQLTLSREARSNQRRLLTALGSEVDSDLLKFNQLKFRKKSLRFGRSAIHDWGLFASEPIAADEMVIEYVGQMIRPVIADLRERQYEAVGIGSSYLFRIDLETIIDATRCGNLSRFINHSCNVSNLMQPLYSF